MRSYQYPADFTPASEGGFVITFPDIPEAITQRETIEESIEQASDALDEAITGRINTGDLVPVPSAAETGQYVIPVPAQTAESCSL
ncbi:MAG: type II toxin-antitoxin system HicB family antitoxin [Acidobacteriaceae bacterium]|nr:type II toxin-antitoxin system HicB family antitoxin [Acidobacteriaceae bacterium]MBV9767553.1 type II toxin-antitoxin system HicB family antitoxin [Acidobacteriaceae bacterium]